MFKPNDFLPSDLEKAQLLYKQLMSEVCKIEVSLFQNKLNDSANVAVRFSHTANELQKLVDSKNQHDQLDELIKQMKAKGLQITRASAMRTEVG